MKFLDIFNAIFLKIYQNRNQNFEESFKNVKNFSKSVKNFIQIIMFHIKTNGPVHWHSPS